MEKKKYSIKEDFSMLALLIIPVGVAVNFVGGQLASILKLPMYLDTIGTIFAAMLCGPWVGAVTGGLTNVVTGIANPVNFAFIPVNVNCRFGNRFSCQKTDVQCVVEMADFYVCNGLGIHYCFSTNCCTCIRWSYRWRYIYYHSSRNGSRSQHLGSILRYRRSIPGIRPYYFILNLLGSYKSNSTKNTC